MKRLIFSLLFIFLGANTAQANCQWGYANALNIDIIHAREMLSTYSTCRGNCKALENNLNLSIAKMSKASSCEAHIFTRASESMINFVAGRFRLIQKQKLGSTWTEEATAEPLEMDRPVFVQPQRTETLPYMDPESQVQAVTTPYPNPAPQVQAATAPEPRIVDGQTKMTISNEAFSALWDRPRPRVQQRNFQRAVIRKPQVNHKARQRQLAQQRLIQHRKQAIIKQKKMHLVKAKRRAMQNHFNQQRLIRQRLLKRREVARQLNRKRVQQRRKILAQRRAR